jgi:hypothetical protein
MTFEDIYIEDIYVDAIVQTGEGTVLVPYLLSAAPPHEWELIFLNTINMMPIKWTTALPKTNTRIHGKQILFECERDAKAIKGGICREILDAHVADANKRYREILETRSREEVQEHRIEEIRSKQLDDLKRQLRGD